MLSQFKSETKGTSAQAFNAGMGKNNLQEMKKVITLFNKV